MSLRVGELELLITAPTDHVDRAAAKIQKTGKDIESKPIKVGVDEKDALAGMDRVEQEAKKLVSARSILKLDADIGRAEKNLAKAIDQLEDLQVRAEGGLDVTADTRRAEATIQRLERHLGGLRQARNSFDIDADAKGALAELEKVQTASKRLVSQQTAIRINADVTHAQRNVARFDAELEVLRSQTPTVEVLAKIERAESNLKTARNRLEDLDGARAQMVVDVNEGGAKQKLQDVADYAEDSGGDGGRRGGAALAGGILAALATIPVAGAVVGVGKAVGEAVVEGFKSGLQQEATRDRVQALTGIDEAAAVRLSYAAGEAYANTFGESIEQNMDTARLGLQFRILDPDATTRDAQKTVQALAGLSTVLEEDVRPIAATVATLLSTGVAKTAEEAYDLIAAGAREGLNRNEDLLDTLTEYPALFRRLGLSGPQALGLISQGLQAGARNTDLAADALKEFQIRSTDASEASKTAYEQLGLNAESMTAQIARGGEEARDGLALVLDKLRETEDPVLRNAAAVGLFGTQAEDLGDALFAMDLSTAVDELDGVTGAAQRMFDTLADNDATKLESAKRNIEVALSGIQGALAVAFSEPLGEFADWVSSHRGELMQFLLDLANGAIDFGITASESVGEFVSGPLAAMVEGIAEAIDWMNGLEGKPQELVDLADGMRDFDSVTGDTVATLEDARTKLNEFGEGAVATGKAHDAAMRTADALALVGEGADGAASSGAELEGQIRAALAAMSDEIAMAEQAGDSQANLAERYTTSRDALMGQLEALGLNREEAQALIDTVVQTPEEKVTRFDSNAFDQQLQVQQLADRVETLPDGSVVIHADTGPAVSEINALIARARESAVTVMVDAIADLGSSSRTSGRAGGTGFAKGAVVEFMANGGLTPMAPVAQMVPPDTWRVVGDRSDVPELFAPLDGSARSWSLILEGLRRMPGTAPMAAGAIASQQPIAAAAAGGAPTIHLGGIVVNGSGLSADELADAIRRGVRDEMNQQFGNRGGL